MCVYIHTGMYICVYIYISPTPPTPSEIWAERSPYTLSESSGELVQLEYLSRVLIMKPLLWLRL